ncbi:MAG: aldo/keto reductase [Candidatus Pelagibacter sp.]|nr:aldo/keto reductase [Candidatus Pelagibacter sp.]
MKLALGTVQFGLPYGISNQSGQVSQEEVKAILSEARLNYIDTLDTAITYGESETCLGEVGIDGFNVITKLPAFPENIQSINSWVNEQIKTSLKRLNTSKLYAILLHRPDQLLTSKGDILWQSLEKLKKDGVVNKIGVSISDPSELGNLTKSFSIDLVQTPFNLVDQRLVLSGWLEKLYASGVEVHTRSAFLQGLLLMPITAIPKKFKYWSPLLNTWHDWLLDNDISAAEACIGFIQAHSQIDKMVVGVQSKQQLKQLIQAEKNQANQVWPDINCSDKDLINPANWNIL